MQHPPRRQGPALPLETARVVAVFGPATRGGYWEPPESIDTMSLFGNVRLDFAEANVYEGLTEIRCFALFGSIEILVPRGIEVDAHGLGIFGGFEQRAPKRRWLERLGRTVRGEDPDAPDEPPAALVAAEDVEPPLLRIRGLSLFGSVVVRVG